MKNTYFSFQNLPKKVYISIYPSMLMLPGPKIKFHFTNKKKSNFCLANEEVVLTESCATKNNFLKKNSQSINPTQPYFTHNTQVYHI